MQKLKLSSIIYILATGVLSAIYILPAIRIGFDYTKLAIILILFYILFIYRRNGVVPIKRLLLNLLPYMLLSFMVAKAGNFKLGFLHPLLITWCMIFPAILCKDLIERGNKAEILCISIITISMLLFVMYNTLDALSDSSNIMRDLTAVSILDEDLRIAYAQDNIGGFGIAYGTGAMVVLLVTLAFNRISSRSIRLIIYILLGYTLYFVLNAQFTTLLFLTMFCSIISLYLSDYGQRHKAQLIFMGIIFLFVTPLFFQLLAQLYDGTTIGVKLLNFNNSLFGDGNITEVSGQRSKFQLDAFILFLKSPIWGSDVTHNLSNATIYVSSHSTMLGIACSTGLIGLISYYRTYWLFIKSIYNSIVNVGKNYKALVLYFFLFSFLNPSETCEASWVIFMIVPLLFNLIKIFAKNV